MLQMVLLIFAYSIIPVPWGMSIFHLLIYKNYWHNFKVKVAFIALALLVYFLLGFVFLRFTDFFFIYPFSNLILKIVGIIIFSASLAIEILTSKTLSTKRIFGSSEVNQNKDKLITVGIYRYARHPRYLEHPLLYLGISLFFGYPIFAFIGLYLFCSFAVTAFFEEKELIRRYGDEYLEYKKNTPSYFFPIK